jgi:pimeloyl-ACP methyl ester carboxylesterase
VTRQTVVLLPGLLCDGAVWAGPRQALEQAGASCHVADFGLLDSIPAMARQVLEQAPDGPLGVAGHSMGGRVALEIARLAPERIQRLALLDTGYQARATGAAGQAEAAERRALLQVACEQGMRAMGRRWARGMVHPDRLDTPIFDAILAMIERKSPSVFEAQVRALLDRPDAADVLQALRCPTLLICGRQDAWSPLARHAEMQNLVQDARLVVIEDAGHMSTMEQPGAVSNALLWLLE